MVRTFSCKYGHEEELSVKFERRRGFGVMEFRVCLSLIGFLVLLWSLLRMNAGEGRSCRIRRVFEVVLEVVFEEVDAFDVVLTKQMC